MSATNHWWLFQLPELLRSTYYDHVIPPEKRIFHQRRHEIILQNVKKKTRRPRQTLPYLLKQNRALRRRPHPYTKIILETELIESVASSYPLSSLQALPFSSSSSSSHSVLPFCPAVFFLYTLSELKSLWVSPTGTRDTSSPCRSSAHTLVSRQPPTLNSGSAVFFSGSSAGDGEWSLSVTVLADSQPLEREPSSLSRGGRSEAEHSGPDCWKRDWKLFFCCSRHASFVMIHNFCVQYF